MKEIKQIPNPELNTILLSDTNVVEYLKKHPTQLESLIHLLQQDEKDQFLVHFSTKNDIKRVKYLVEHGADIHAQDDYALCSSTAEGHLDVVNYLERIINERD